MSTQYRIPVEETFSWQRPIIDKDLVTAPGTPAKGDRYIMAGVGGAWSTGAIKDIAWYDGATWKYDVPAEGWTVFVKDEDLNYYYSGSAWIAIPASHTQGTDTTLGTMGADIAMGTHQVTGLSVPDASGEAIRQTATITETSLGAAVSATPTWDDGLGCILMTL